MAFTFLVEVVTATHFSWPENDMYLIASSRDGPRHAHHLDRNDSEREVVNAWSMTASQCEVLDSSTEWVLDRMFRRLWNHCHMEGDFIRFRSRYRNDSAKVNQVLSPLVILSWFHLSVSLHLFSLDTRSHAIVSHKYRISSNPPLLEIGGCLGTIASHQVKNNHYSSARATLARTSLQCAGHLSIFTTFWV